MLKLLIALTLILTACGDVKFEKGSVEGAACATCSNPPTFHGVDEDYTTPASNQVDIVFIVDNSKSMRVEQTQLSTRLNDFTDKIANLDWRIAITSTDVTSGTGLKQGRLKPFNTTGNPLYITKTTTNYSSLFESSVVLGDDGSSVEEGVNATRYVAERNESNWMRPTAQFAAVILSDEDECSSQDPRYCDDRNKPENLINKISFLYGSQKNFSFHSIVVADTDCLDYQETQVNPSTGYNIKSWIGLNYLKLTNLTGGITGDICAQTKSYTEQLNDMGQLITNFSTSVSLQCAPRDDVISATYTSGVNNGSPVNGHISGTRFIFDEVVQPGTSMNLVYECQD
jgi:hypothetical protein